MNYKKLGKTDLILPQIGFGSGQFGDMYGDTTQENCNETVSMAIDNGINYFDCAPSYGPEGLAEERLGIALQGHDRSKLVINTKLGRWDHGVVGDPVYDYDFTPERARIEIENSLRRLKTDYVDIYQIHDVNNCHDLNFIVNETIPALQNLKKEGKIRYIGITGVYLDTLKYIAERSDGVDSILSFCRYNLVDRTLEGYFKDVCTQKGIGLINASVLYMGMLTPNVKTLVHWRGKKLIKEMTAAVEKANVLCEKANTNLAEQACLFGLGFEEPASTLIGMGRPSSLIRNLALIEKTRNFDLESELLELFDGISLFPDQGQENGISIRGSFSDVKNN